MHKDSTAFLQAGALVWVMTEVSHTPAAVAVLPALADRAVALAAPLHGVLLRLCLAEAGASIPALPPSTVLSPVQSLPARSQWACLLQGGMFYARVGWCMNVTPAARQKRLTPDFCLEAGVSWKNITFGEKGEEEKKYFLFQNDLSPAV